MLILVEQVSLHIDVKLNTRVISSSNSHCRSGTTFNTIHHSIKYRVEFKWPTGATQNKTHDTCVVIGYKNNKSIWKAVTYRAWCDMMMSCIASAASGSAILLVLAKLLLLVLQQLLIMLVFGLEHGKEVPDSRLGVRRDVRTCTRQVISPHSTRTPSYATR